MHTVWQCHKQHHLFADDPNCQLQNAHVTEVTFWDSKQQNRHWSVQPFAVVMAKCAHTTVTPPVQYRLYATSSQWPHQYNTGCITHHSDSINTTQVTCFSSSAWDVNGLAGATGCHSSFAAVRNSIQRQNTKQAHEHEEVARCKQLTSIAQHSEWCSHHRPTQAEEDWMTSQMPHSLWTRAINKQASTWVSLDSTAPPLPMTKTLFKKWVGYVLAKNRIKRETNEQDTRRQSPLKNEKKTKKDRKTSMADSERQVIVYTHKWDWQRLSVCSCIMEDWVMESVCVFMCNGGLGWWMASKHAHRASLSSGSIS